MVSKYFDVMSDHHDMHAATCFICDFISEKSDLKVHRNTEKEITGSTVSYNSYGILFMERELLLWLSCFVICAPWILVQCKTVAIIILPDIEAHVFCHFFLTVSVNYSTYLVVYMSTMYHLACIFHLYRHT